MPGCASSFPGLRRDKLIAMYNLKVTRKKIRLTPHVLRALPLRHFEKAVNFIFYEFIF